MTMRMWPMAAKITRGSCELLLHRRRHRVRHRCHRTLMLTVLAFIDHTITVAVWTRFSFHGASSVLF
jgi:hypothetical protein